MAHYMISPLLFPGLKWILYDGDLRLDSLLGQLYIEPLALTTTSASMALRHH